MNITHRNQLGELLNELGLTGEMAEIGVGYGENAEVILDSWKGRTLHLVDPYARFPADVYRDYINSRVDMEAMERYAHKKLGRFGARAAWVKRTSAYAAHRFDPESLDCVYIDANHGYRSVSMDIMAWHTKVKHGGILGGHDYFDREEFEPENGFVCGVKSAVDEFVAQHGLELTTCECTSWFVRMP